MRRSSCSPVELKRSESGCPGLHSPGMAHQEGAVLYVTGARSPVSSHVTCSQRDAESLRGWKPAPAFCKVRPRKTSAAYLPSCTPATRNDCQICDLPTRAATAGRRRRACFFRRTPHLVRRSSSHQLSASPTLDLRKPGSHSRHGCRSVLRPRCYCSGSAVPVVPGLQIIPGQIWPVHLSAAQCCTRFIDGRCVQATCALPTPLKRTSCRWGALRARKQGPASWHIPSVPRCLRGSRMRHSTE